MLSIVPVVYNSDVIVEVFRRDSTITLLPQLAFNNWVRNEEPDRVTRNWKALNPNKGLIKL